VNVKAASLDARGPVYAGTTVNIQTQGNLTNQQTLAARDNITLSAGGMLTNNGIIEAGVNADTSRNATGDVSLNAQNFNNTGKTVVASRTLTVNTSQTLNNQAGTLRRRANREHHGRDPGQPEQWPGAEQRYVERHGQSGPQH